MLRQRKATRLLLTEPLLRTERVLIAPERLRLERGHAQAVWDDAQPRLGRLVYGPHLEWLASEWVLSHASAETVGGAVNLAGSSVLRAGGETHRVDLVAVDPGARDGGRVCAVGEVKATNEPVGIDQLARLDHIVALLGSARAAATVRRLLVSRRGFTSELKRLARSRNDVELVDLHRLYRGT